jgi:Domain of unknown function (DUF4168)
MNLSNLCRNLVFACVATFFCLSLWLSYPTMGWADPAPSTGPSTTSTLTEGSAETTDIASNKISQFSRAYVAVVDLITAHENDLQKAETATESSQIEKLIQSEALEAIQSNGLTLPEYLQLVGLANRDSEFREQILAAMEEK